MSKIRIAWICHLSNAQIRSQLKYEKWTLWAIVRRIVGLVSISDFAIWNTNAISEFEKFEDVELHIISPHLYIYGIQEFELNSIHYHFFKSEDDNLITRFKYKLKRRPKTSYKKNAAIISTLIDKINPQIIHMIGAENPYYGESAFLLPNHIPFIVTPQTLMSDPKFLVNYPISRDLYTYRASVETKILSRADYVGTKTPYFREKISEIISHKVKFLDVALALGESIDLDNFKKEYDFVYFSADISKAADHAIEAFAIAKRTSPNITLHVVGGYSDSYIITLRNMMLSLGIGDEVDFTGKLPTHHDVISEIRKAKFAVLPLKVDLIASTLREAMANGLPVVTTVTPATPTLNEKRESVLLSDIGDFAKMAENMCRLMADENLSQELRNNAARTVEELYSNAANMREWKSNYYAILKNER